jgi:hypothetical protein
MASLLWEEFARLFRPGPSPAGADTAAQKPPLVFAQSADELRRGIDCLHGLCPMLSDTFLQRNGLFLLRAFENEAQRLSVAHATAVDPHKVRLQSSSIVDVVAPRINADGSSGVLAGRTLLEALAQSARGADGGTARQSMEAILLLTLILHTYISRARATGLQAWQARAASMAVTLALGAEGILSRLAPVVHS